MGRAGEHNKVCEGVFVVGGSQLSEGSDCQVYALDLGELVLVDCGAGRSWQTLQVNLRSARLEPARLHTLILTHAHIDHIGAAARIQRETGCRVVAHALDAPAIESADRHFTVADLYAVDLEAVPVSHRVEGSEEALRFTRGALRLLHTPGHTPGSLAVVFEGPEGRVLFGQDVHGPFSPAFGSDLDAWHRSMEGLLALQADILCEGHFGVFRPAAAVEKFLRGQLASKKSIMPVPRKL